MRADSPATCTAQSDPSDFLCEEELTAVLAFLRVQVFLLITEDIGLPQEEEGASCYWMCGLRVAGHFRHALVSAVGTGDAVWIPRPRPVRIPVVVRGHSLDTQYLRRLAVHGRNNT